MSGQTGSVLPPDIQGQMRATSRGRTGIGGAAPENAAAARARAQAIDPQGDLEEDPPAEPEAEVREELKVCPQVRCRTTLDDEWNFCAKCGQDLVRGGPAKSLGIEFTEDDVHDYLFKGYLVKEIKILGKHKVTIKTSQPQDMVEIDDYLMNRRWSKDKNNNERKISELLVAQMSTLCTTASMASKFDSDSLGSNLEARMNWLLERGSAFVDMLSTKVILFNQAITEHVKKADTVLGS